MAKINRPEKNIVPFASASQASERTVFDQSTASDDIATNLNSSYERGFGVLGPGQKPTRQDMNALGYTISALAAYVYQDGVPMWAAAQEYHKHSLTNYNGVIYESVQNNNVGNNPEDSNNSGFGIWNEFNELAVQGAGSEAEDFIALNDEYYVYYLKPDAFILLRRTAQNTLVQVNAIPDSAGIPDEAGFKACRVSDTRIAVCGKANIYMIDIDLSTGSFTKVGNSGTVTVGAGNHDIVSIKNDPTKDTIVLYCEDAQDIKNYTFDGTDFTFEGIKLSGPFSGAGSLAVSNRDEQQIVYLLQPASNTIYTLSYNGSLFDIPGITSTSGFTVVPTWLSSGTDNSLVANNAAGDIVAIDAAGSLLAEAGSVLNAGSSLGGVTMLAKNMLVTFDTNTLITKLYVSTAGNISAQFWRVLSSQGVGFNSSALNLKSKNIQDAVKEVVTEMIYPVGSVWENLADSRNPAEILGFGTWEKDEGNFLIAVDEADPELSTPNTTGGETSYYTEEHVLTVDELPPHDHDILLQYQGNNKASEGTAYAAQREIDAGDFSGTDTRQTSSVGGGQGHSHYVSNHLPPYLTVYRWIRIA